MTWFTTLLAWLAVAALFWSTWVFWRFVERTPLELRRIATALESLVDLQRRQAERSAKPDETAETGEGSSDTGPRKVSEIESYGDLSRVGLLKKPKT